MPLVKTVLFFFLIGVSNFVWSQQFEHPITYTTKSDLDFIKSSLKENALLKKSFFEIKAEVDSWIDKDIDVPVPKDPAGGYTHEKHKANYTLMFNSGMLYQLTGDAKYALLVKQLLLKYAILNPTLKNHPEATSSSPGHIFWQALNDANWLVYTGLAFDLVHDYLTVAERQTIAVGAFKPEVDFFTIDLKQWFDLIHNHAVWACAGVGIVGIATDNAHYVDMALYGSEKNGKSGLLAQLNGLFSPDGYYKEGPYYTRYAILPLYVFANALNNTRPALKIFEYKNAVLQKALTGALQQTNINGAIYSYNDALKEKTFLSNELVEAIDISWNVYGANTGLLSVAKEQNRVTLTKGGAAMAEVLIKQKDIPKYYPYQSIEFTDGPEGKDGGVSIMRTGKNDSLSSLIFKYSTHGMQHGHFDKLNINFYDNGNEILQDYGAARFISVEQKWGGRYLPETKTYTQQTIAHNTITVDEASQFNGEEKESEKYHPNKRFSNMGNGPIQVVSVEDNKSYKDVHLDRTIYMIQLPDTKKPLMMDIFKIQAKTNHQYDLPFNYLGSLISTNAKYTAFTNSQTTLGNKNGYQFLWKEAVANAAAPLAQLTFLNHNTFYTLSSLTDDSTKLFFTRIGANDPNFNLRRDPSYIIRKTGKAQTYINILEANGSFDPTAEISINSYPSVEKIELLQDDDVYTVVQIMIAKKSLLVIQCNNSFESKKSHSFINNHQTVQWAGPFFIQYQGTRLINSN